MLPEGQPEHIRISGPYAEVCSVSCDSREAGISETGQHRWPSLLLETCGSRSIHVASQAFSALASVKISLRQQGNLDRPLPVPPPGKAGAGGFPPRRRRRGSPHKRVPAPLVHPPLGDRASTTPLSRSRCGTGRRLRAPGLLRAQHRIQQDQQLSHTRHHRDFCWFARFEQMPVKRLNHRIITDAREHAHVQQRAHLRTPTPDAPSAFRGSTVIVKRSNTDQRCGLLTVQAA
jgi:hypothetical protein